MRTLLSCLGILLLAGTLASADEPKPIVDKDYRFRIDHPGKGWRLLPERDIKKLVPAACAGAVGPRGVYGAVIVEEAGKTTAEAFAPVLIDNMPLENKEIVSPHKMTFAGQSVIRYEVTGRINGMEAHYVNHVFVRDGHLFQVLGWGLKAMSPLVYLDSFFDAFTLLPGTVRTRARSTVTDDARGPGWRVHQGVFESAPMRLRVAGSDGWRVIVGGELKTLNPDAEVGFELSQPSAYGVVIPEMARGVDKAAFVKHVTNQWGDGIKAEAIGEPVSYTAAGRPVALQRFLVHGDVPFEFLRGAFFDGSICYQLQFWHLASLSKEVRRRLPQALRGIRVLTQGEADAVAQAMAKKPDPENSVGLGFALRRGTYRDFSHGLSIVKPKRRTWRFNVGQHARAVNPAAALSFVDQENGMQGLLIVDDLVDMDGATYHAQVLEGMFGSEHAALDETPETAQLRGATARWSSVEEDQGPMQFTHRVTTAVRGKVGIQLLMWGFPGNMHAAAAVRTWAELIAGIRLQDPLTAFHEANGQMTDLRLGYRIRPGNVMGASRELAPASIASIASIRIWRHGRQAVLTCAFCALDAGHDMTWFRQFIGRVLIERVTPEGAASDSTPSKLGGLAAERMSMITPTEQSHTWLASRDRSFFAVCLIGPPDKDAGWFEKIRASFEFVD